MRKAKVLIVDDNPSLGTLLKLRLESDGYEVETAEDGFGGFERVVHGKPDVVILDEVMPGFSGYQVVKKIRGLQGAERHVPIIVISAMHTMRHVFDDLYVHAFIPKPFESAELIKHVESALAKARRARERPRQTVELQGEGQTVQLEGAEECVIEKLTRYLQALGYDVKISHDNANSITFALSKTDFE